MTKYVNDKTWAICVIYSNLNLIINQNIAKNIFSNEVVDYLVNFQICPFHIPFLTSKTQKPQPTESPQNLNSPKCCRGLISSLTAYPVSLSGHRKILNLLHLYIYIYIILYLFNNMV